LTALGQGFHMGDCRWSCAAVRVTIYRAILELHGNRIGRRFVGPHTGIPAEVRVYPHWMIAPLCASGMNGSKCRTAARTGVESSGRLGVPGVLGFPLCGAFEKKFSNSIHIEIVALDM
jgi:hypothetical protein